MHTHLLIVFFFFFLKTKLLEEIWPQFKVVRWPSTHSQNTDMLIECHSMSFKLKSNVMLWAPFWLVSANSNVWLVQELGNKPHFEIPLFDILSVLEFYPEQKSFPFRSEVKKCGTVRPY